MDLERWFPQCRGRGRGHKPGTGRSNPLQQGCKVGLGLCPQNTGGLFAFPRVSWPATDPVGILDLLPRLEAPASMHLCLRGFEGASPSQLSPLVIGAMPNLVTKPQDRGRLVSWRPFKGGETKAQKGEPTTQYHLDSGRGTGLVPGRSLSRGS